MLDAAQERLAQVQLKLAEANADRAERLAILYL